NTLVLRTRRWSACTRAKRTASWSRIDPLTSHRTTSSAPRLRGFRNRNSTHSPPCRRLCRAVAENRSDLVERALVDDRAVWPRGGGTDGRPTGSQRPAFGPGVAGHDPKKERPD